MPNVVRLIAVAMLSLTLGLHWMVLQTVAWTAMLAQRVQGMTVWDAVTTTFDGQHPCRLCLVVKEGKAGGSRGQEVPVVQGIKLEVFLAQRPTGWIRDEPIGVTLEWGRAGRAASWREPPALRPPRQA